MISYTSNYDERVRNNLQKDTLDEMYSWHYRTDSSDDKSVSLVIAVKGRRHIGSASLICIGCGLCNADCECKS